MDPDTYRRFVETYGTGRIMSAEETSRYTMRADEIERLLKEIGETAGKTSGSLKHLAKDLLEPTGETTTYTDDEFQEKLEEAELVGWKNAMEQVADLVCRMSEENLTSLVNPDKLLERMSDLKPHANGE